ncbi:lipopolysaccharide biosynthesis protein [Gloeothece citriformis PCC 7424]|uniref:Lipopolysaccharide biosynthesis protein n=1 Tax=Gloeothece citriformis (strain PCC 7424) TaxID=65393 RepID=B7KAN6_GLOC7|nr:tyrosine-protein kinase domain-containing protein [Gloeothece citriformis]ACK68708.1 lipopolysaccharide biosynthesis protein [Gloeothece citriformis PCC 7424]
MVTNFNKLSVNDQFQEFPSEELEESSASSKGGTNFKPYLRTLIRKAWLVLGLTTLGTSAALFWNAQAPNMYTGNFYLLVEPITPFSKVSDPSTIARTGGVPRDDLFSLDYPTNLAFLQSPGMTFQLAQDVHQKKPTRSVPAIWQDLRKNLVVERVGRTPTTATKIFAVTYKGEDPQEVKAVLEVAADTFLNYSVEDRETSLKAGVKFIAEQLPALQERLKKLQSEQERLRQQYDLINPTTKGQEVLTQLSNIEQQLLDVQTELKAQQSLYQTLRGQLNFTPEEALAAASLSQDPTRLPLLTQLQQIESQIAIESSKFTPENPTLKALEEQRQNLSNLLDQTTQEIIQQNSIITPGNSDILNHQDPTRLQLINQLVQTNNQIQQLEVRYQSLQQTKARWEQQAKLYPAVIRQYEDLDRQITLTSQILDRLLTQRETLKVESAQELPWQLISPPQIPLDAEGKPVAEPPDPKKKLAAGLMGGLLLGAAIAFLWEKQRNIFYGVEDLKDAFSLPVLGNIPWDNASDSVPGLTKPLEGKSADSESEIDPHVIHSLNNRGVLFLNAFDLLYSELSFLYNHPPLHSLVVSSVQAQDGQTTIALYLAKAAAATGKRVLLVDTNLASPQLHSWFNLPNYKGLSDLLMDEELASYDVIQPSQEIDNLFVLSAGSAQAPASKLLWFPRMQSLMRELKVRYDLIIYDAPHFYESTDIGFLGAQTDGIVMVVGIGKTPPYLVKQAVEEINKLRLPLLGLVANHTLPAPIGFF